jgi:hypothetical protein
MYADISGLNSRRYSASFAKGKLAAATASIGGPLSDGSTTMPRVARHYKMVELLSKAHQKVEG